MPPTFAIYDLLVGKHGLAFGTPPLQTSVLIRHAGFIHLGKDPLCPTIIFRQVRADFFRPVIAPAHSLVLCMITRDDTRHTCLWAHASFDSVIFRR